ncbi:MAG: LamG domain-containing protein [Ferruginibacter sp.]
MEFKNMIGSITSRRLKVLIFIPVGLLAILTAISCNAQKKLRGKAKLIGYWKLRGDSKDYSGMGNDGINHGVVLSKGMDPIFSGDSAYIEVPDNKSLKFGSDDFSMSVWVKADKGARVGGDIINKFDDSLRKGLNFHILSSSSAYGGPSDSRNVFFGIDDAKEGEWIDCGRPLATNNLISLFIVYKNQLYAGVAGATDPKNARGMFRYDGDGKWVDCGRPMEDPNTQSIMCGVVLNGAIYAGTGKWDYYDQETAGKTAGVYKYLGGTKWAEYGKFPPGKKRIHSMSVYNGTLYVNDDQGETYSYDTLNGKWKLEHKLKNYKLISSSVYRDQLFNGSSTTIWKLDKNGNWDTVGKFNSMYITQTHTFETYKGQFYGGTWSNGYIIRYIADGKWENRGWVGSEETSLIETTIPYVPMRKNEIMELTVYNGKMYAGVIPKGEVWRYDGGEKTKLIRRLVHNPEYSVDVHESWCRVPAMAVFQGKLFAGTGSARGFPTDVQKAETGKVYRWQAGQAVTFDDDIGTEWRHLTAVKEKEQLKLYIDGKLVSSSAMSGSLFNVENDRPLLIGFGSQNYFKGSIKDVRVYAGALSPGDIRGN